ncbi:MAG TPA: pyruvate kinase, partial [Marinilabiliaceae bacterium]|nr:pyruvate kinase [Marinilabiliaceae bacterium]
ELSLSYGVYPRLTEPGSSKSDIMHKTVAKLKKKGILDDNDLVAYLGGSFGIGGGTTYLEIITVDGLINKIDRYVD